MSTPKIINPFEEPRCSFCNRNQRQALGLMVSNPPGAAVCIKCALQCVNSSVAALEVKLQPQQNPAPEAKV